MGRTNLPYDPTKLPRELKKFYISASEKDIQEMMDSLNINNLDELFSHIPEEVKMLTPNYNKVGKHLEYDDLINHVNEVADMNNICTSFIGDGLQQFKIPAIVAKVCAVRGLTTAYTPYQPERSQGTLMTLWLYSQMLSKLTGFEAVNASLYDRSTALFEAMNTATRLTRGKKTVLVCESIYPGDLEVLETMQKNTQLKIVRIPIDKESGITQLQQIEDTIGKNLEDLAGIAFPQINHFGLLEDVHLFTDIATKHNVQSIAIIDPMLISKGGLLPPVEYGSQQQGADMFVGEGQHITLDANFGGPGLGVFGIRYNQSKKNAIRSTAGRYVGKTKDAKGNDALCMVLSTREQHIRREKATSNICSNQSFVASIAGAAILARGEDGMAKATSTARENALYAYSKLCALEGVKDPYTKQFFNEFTLEIDEKINKLIATTRKEKIHIGVDVTNRDGNKRNLLKLSFSDIHSKKDIDELIKVLKKKESTKSINSLNIEERFLRKGAIGLPNLSEEELEKYYQGLGDQNISPDDHIYPLGSCTMKYNPYINDYAASLDGFTKIHPQAPQEDTQGCLFILHEIQEMFKGITGLDAVTTQPLAGAQGELVGLKLFQAYHQDKDPENIRDVVLIPRSAHGTNPATAAMAGFENKTIDGVKVGIITIEASEKGQINFEQLEEMVSQYSRRISGIMVTNPNTSGIFESEFHKMAELVHSVGGLVYMDGANMNAIAGIVDLKKLGVDAVHNNLHKTWTIPHGGGGPGDAIVAVSEKLIDYLPGIQVVKNGELYESIIPKKTIGSIHRHFGNFAHKVRCYTYIKALGDEGIYQMSAVSVLSAKYLYNRLQSIYPTLPVNCEKIERMHEFIITIGDQIFDKIIAGGTPKALAIAKIGKLFLDFGLHAPTVAFPEVYGLMIEPTETFTKAELDRFAEVVEKIYQLIQDTPEVLTTAPHFTPCLKVDEVLANKNLTLCEDFQTLPNIAKNYIHPSELEKMNIDVICEKILERHNEIK